MKKLFQYEFYKTRHNMLTYIIAAICCGIALFFTNEDCILDPMIPGTPQNITGTFINEVADVGIAILIIIGSYTIFSFGNDIKYRCINYELLSGNSRKVIFLSHYLWCFLFSGSVITVALFVGCCKYGIYNWMLEVSKNSAYILRVIFGIYLISFAIISVCMVFFIIIKDTARATITTFIYLFLTCYIMAAIVNSRMGEQIASAYVNPNGVLLLYPSYLWRWILNPGLNVSQVICGFLIAVIWCAIAFLINRALFCKMEMN